MQNHSLKFQSATKLQQQDLPIPIYELKMQLEEPPIWRRVLVSGDISLGKLHEVVQIAMGWSNSHLHEFIVDADSYSDPEFEIEKTRNEFQYTLCRVAQRERSFLAYSYDFGDGWEHQIRVERIIESDDRYPGWPLCLEGARACPPEDCGGSGGYKDLLQTISNPRHRRYQELIEWIGSNFDPEAFDLKAVNQTLKRIKMTNG